MTELDARAVRRGMRYYVMFDCDIPGMYVKTTEEIGLAARSVAPNSRFSVRPLLALEVEEHGDYFRIKYDESDVYYAIMYGSRESAEFTLKTLEKGWENTPAQKNLDLRFVFVTGAHNCTLCPRDREELYGQPANV